MSTRIVVERMEAGTRRERRKSLLGLCFVLVTLLSPLSPSSRSVPRPHRIGSIDRTDRFHLDTSVSTAPWRSTSADRQQSEHRFLSPLPTRISFGEAEEKISPQLDSPPLRLFFRGERALSACHRIDTSATTKKRKPFRRWFGRFPCQRRGRRGITKP